MFSKSAGLFFNCQCSVGGGCSDSPRSARIFGIGCLLDENHVLSAAHCWTGIEARFEWPAVMTLHGLFRCELAFCSEESDIMLLRMVEHIQKPPGDFEQPKQYAALSDEHVFLGSQVGTISQLNLLDRQGETSTRTHFSAGFVSMWLLENRPPRFALSGTVIQKGFSGSPVFLPSGLVVGVLVESLSFRANFLDPQAPIYVLPVISPIHPIIASLRGALNSEQSQR